MTFPVPHSVLLVEDDASLRLALRTHFLRHGWCVTVASGVREAKTALSLGTFDLILSDMRMLDGDGFQVLLAAQASAPRSAVLFLTASASVPEAVQAVRGGAVDYLAKPVSFELLLSHAHRVLRETIPFAVAKVPDLPGAQGPSVPAGSADRAGSPVSMSELEKSHLAHTLELVGGNRTRAAEVLGISIRTLRNKVRQYDLPPRRYA